MPYLEMITDSEGTQFKVLPDGQPIDVTPTGASTGTIFRPDSENPRTGKLYTIETVNGGSTKCERLSHSVGDGFTVKGDGSSVDVMYVTGWERAQGRIIRTLLVKSKVDAFHKGR